MDSNNNSANMKLSPGMMCLVIGYVGEPHNVGKTVTLKKVASGILPDGSPTYCWEVSGEGIRWRMRNRTGSVTTAGVGNRGWILAQHLMPIRPEEGPLEITDVVIKKEKA